MQHFGVLNIDKPLGMTSREAVDRVKRLVRPVKTGHAGTLDPLATGVLLVCVGPATRLIEYAHRLPKRYRATFLLGRSSPTDDLEGDVQLFDGAPEPTRTEVEAALRRFVGEIEQRPPAFSAVKVGGKRAYEAARRGKQLEIPTRKVTIHRLELVTYDYPELVLNVECGSGTYIRSLGRDLAVWLGTAGVMSALVRTAIGPFSVDDAVDGDSLDSETLATNMQPPQSLLVDLPKITLDEVELIEIRNGRPIPLKNAPPESQEIAALGPDGRLVGLLTTKSDGRLWPLRNLVS